MCPHSTTCRALFSMTIHSHSSRFVVVAFQSRTFGIGTPSDRKYSYRNFTFHTISARNSAVIGQSETLRRSLNRMSKTRHDPPLSIFVKRRMASDVCPTDWATMSQLLVKIEIEMSPCQTVFLVIPLEQATKSAKERYGVRKRSWKLCVVKGMLSAGYLVWLLMFFELDENQERSKNDGRIGVGYQNG